MEQNILTNTQYSRLKQKISDVSGIEPTIFSGDTSVYSEEDQMVRGFFRDTDILDGEVFINTFDKKAWYRANDTIEEIGGGGTTLIAGENVYLSGSTINITGGTFDSLDITNTLSAQTLGVSGDTTLNSLEVENIILNNVGTGQPVYNLGIDISGNTVNVEPYEGFSRVIFVDSITGLDESDIERGQPWKPYNSLKYAEDSITDNVLNVSGTTTNGDETLSGITDVDFALMEVGQRIIGTGIPNYAYITELIGGGSDNNSIKINEVCTADGTDISITLLNKYLIKVMPGNYNPTETLGKESVSWYFEPKTEVVKFNAGLLFRWDSGFGTWYDGFDVFGKGDFKTYTDGVYRLYDFNAWNNRLKFTFECNTALSTNSSTVLMYPASYIYSVTRTEKISVRGDIKSTNGVAFGTSYSKVEIYGNLWSTTTNAFTSSGGDTIINANYVFGGAGYGISSASRGYSVYNIANCTGFYFNIGRSNQIIINVGYGGSLYINKATSTLPFGNIVLNGSFGTTEIYYPLNYYYNYHKIYLNGNIQKLTLTDGHVVGGSVNELIQDGGFLEGVLLSDNGKNFIFNDGISNCKTSIQVRYDSTKFIQFNGGTHTIESNFVDIGQTKRSMFFYVNGANVTIKGSGNVRNPASTYRNEFIRLNAGKLKLSGTYKNDVRLVNYNGGLLVLDRVTLVTENIYDFTTLIKANVSGLNVHVLSGGVNANCGTGELLSAKKWKEKITVTSVANTSISLNDDSGTETFSESDTTTYNTEILLAGRLTSLINASSSLDITATDNGDGTFSVESDTAGIPCSSSSLSNCSSELLRYNSYAITNVTGGPVIENSAIDF